MRVRLACVSRAHQELLQPEDREAWSFHPGISGSQENGERDSWGKCGPLERAHDIGVEVSGSGPRHII